MEKLRAACRRIVKRAQSGVRLASARPGRDCESLAFERNAQGRLLGKHFERAQI
jgi:hypothetical protein